MSADALDRPRPRQKFGRKARQDYARRKSVEELLEPARDGLADFLQNPSLLPKRPPGRP